MSKCSTRVSIEHRHKRLDKEPLWLTYSLTQLNLMHGCLGTVELQSSGSVIGVHYLFSHLIDEEDEAQRIQ